MNRRELLQRGLESSCLMLLGGAATQPLLAAVGKQEFENAASVLQRATVSGRVDAAALYVKQEQREFTRTFGAAKSSDDMFLLASISKPISVTALMTLYDQGKFQLDDRVQKFIPEFSAGARKQITIRQLLTHVSGLPDQLPENAELRKRHAPLQSFVAGAIRTPLLFPPGSRYQYSSMAILLASEIASRISGRNFLEFIDDAVFKPLEMRRSALGLGKFRLQDMLRCQVANAAKESGAGDPNTKDWDWNSQYWRSLGCPWGCVHASIKDTATFFSEFLSRGHQLLKPQTTKMVITNHNRAGFTPRGLGFAVGARAGSPGCSQATFGHTGSTGTLAWADPESDTICIVLTTLPGGAANPHPRKVVSDQIAAS